MISLYLPSMQIILCLMYGFFLALIYLGLLWGTVKSLSKMSHKGLCLFASAVLRLTVFLLGAVFFSQHQVARFLWIVAAFIITRFILVSFVKIKDVS